MSSNATLAPTDQPNAEGSWPDFPTLLRKPLSERDVRLLAVRAEAQRLPRLLAEQERHQAATRQPRHHHGSQDGGADGFLPCAAERE